MGREIHIIDYYENSGEGIEHYKDVLDELGKEKGYRYGTHGAPHDIRKREFGNQAKRLIQSAAAIGLKFVVAPGSASKAVSSRCGRS